MSKKKELIEDIKRSLEIVWQEKRNELQEKKKRKSNELVGRGYSLAGREKQIIKLYIDYYKDAADEFSVKTKHKLDLYKTGKLNEDNKNEIFKSIEGKYKGSIRTLE